MKTTLTIIFFTMMNSAVRSTNKMLTEKQDELPQYVSKACSKELIFNYTGGSDDGEIRRSMVPSEILQNSCSNFYDSCCLDDEFTILTDAAGENLSNLKNGMLKYKNSISLVANVDTSIIENLCKQVDENEMKSSKLTKDKIIDSFKNLK